MKIVLLEDDLDYKETIKEYLESLKYSVDDFEDGQEALDAIYENHYHLLILDIRVPSLNGYELVKQIKSDNINIPIIFITSLTDINNLSLGYELGCNDYIKKPFSPKELKYRVEQLIKSFYFSTTKEYVELTNDFLYEPVNKELLKDSKKIELTKKEQEIVFCLLSYKNQFVSIDKLRFEVWNDKFINESDIRVCIKNIRQKTFKEFILNKRGVGYKIERA
ncbi:MAG: response regulator transcription factor [Campylobacterota bacterium]